jgi:hypothetical protein
MAITIYQGDTGRPFKFPLTFSDGSKPNMNGFSNANFVLHFYNAAGPTTVVAAGTFLVVQDSTGAYNTVVYYPLASEVNTVATWAVWLQVIFASGPVTWTPDNIIISAKQ